jgi:hypothetical protein
MARVIPERIAKIEQCLGTFIFWAAQSANSPISHAEASELLNMLASEKNPGGSMLERAMRLHIDIHEKGMTGQMNDARHELIKQWRALRGTHG